MTTVARLHVWVIQTGEPVHLDGPAVRPMRAMNLADALISRGHRVTLWTSRFSHVGKRHRDFRGTSARVGDSLVIRLLDSAGYRANIGLARLLDHAALSRAFLRAVRQEPLPDVAFVGYPPIELADAAMGFLSHRGVPTLIDVKDQWPDIFDRAFPEPFRPACRVLLTPYRHIARRTIGRATGICSMTEEFLDWSLSLADRPRRCFDLVAPLVASGPTSDRATRLEAEHWWDSIGVLAGRRHRIAFVGSMSRAFDFEWVIEAIRSGAQCEDGPEAVLCGDGDLLAALRRRLRGVANVVLPGRVNREQAEVLYARSAICLAPYFRTCDFQLSIPNKIFDGIAHGVPVVTTLGGPTQRLLESRRLGSCVSAPTAAALRVALRQWDLGPAERSAFSFRSRAIAAAEFSVESVYRSLAIHLETMASDKSCLLGAGLGRRPFSASS